MFKIIFTVDKDITLLMTIGTNIILIVLSKLPLIMLKLGNFSLQF